MHNFKQFSLLWTSTLMLRHISWCVHHFTPQVTTMHILTVSSAVSQNANKLLKLGVWKMSLCSQSCNNSVVLPQVGATLKLLFRETSVLALMWRRRWCHNVITFIFSFCPSAQSRTPSSTAGQSGLPQRKTALEHITSFVTTQQVFSVGSFNWWEKKSNNRVFNSFNKLKTD